MRLFATLAIVAVACDPPPPVKSASGELIDGVSFEESFPLSNEVKDASLRGERLRSGVALMDKHGIFALKGDYRATGVLDKSTLTIIVKPVAGQERRATFRSCATDELCAFFEEATAQGVVERKPLVCRSPIPCEKPASQ